MPMFNCSADAQHRSVFTCENWNGSAQYLLVLKIVSSHSRHAMLCMQPLVAWLSD